MSSAPRRILYLHGFASGPSSKKAQYFKNKFAGEGIALEIPDLAEGAFERLTITGQLAVIERLADSGRVSLIGSSLGGYLAALFAARHATVEKIMLMAPAFSFAKRFQALIGERNFEDWKRTGVLKVFHYSEGRQVSLRHALMEDAARYEEYPEFPQPALVFQGLLDTAVLPSLAEEFARRHPDTDLRLVDSDHELLNVLPDMWSAAKAFLL